MRQRTIWSIVAGLVALVVTGLAVASQHGAQPDTRARASLKAVNVGGNLEGILVGGAGAPHWKLLATFSATLADSGAVSNGKMGKPTSDNSALLYRGGCRSKKADPATSERGKKKGHGKRQP